MTQAQVRFNSALERKPVGAVALGVQPGKFTPPNSSEPKQLPCRNRIVLNTICDRNEALLPSLSIV